MPQPAQISVAILAGGLGTRLRSVVADRPKVMAPVLGRPFLAWWLDTLDAAGFREVTICTGHLAGQIEDHFGSRHGNLSLQYSHEHTPLGTGGALHLALPHLTNKWVLAMNGDSYCVTDFSALVRQCQSSSLPGGLVLAQAEDTRRFGRIIQQSDGRIIEFLEKTGTTGPGWINAGLYLVPRSHLASISADRPVSLEREVLPHWLEEGLFGFRADGPFIDIGTPESFAQAEAFFSSSATHQLKAA